MTIVASNSLTVSNVNDGTITHTAYAYSADGTDRFTTVYPNLNLLSLSSVKIGQYLNWSNGLDLFNNSKRAVFDYIQVTPNQTYTLSSSWNSWYISVYGYSDKTSSAKYILTGGKMQPITGSGFSESQNVTFTVPSDCNYLRVQVANDNTNTSASVVKSVKAKVELGSTATPYMPSSSEATTADWPSYIGQYTDFTQADSTNPSAYTWSLIRGNDGKDGQDGKSGDPGKIVSDTEPSTKFVGLTWKYSGITAIDASDGTSIQPSTEYYWNGNNWIINQINAHNINVDDLSAISTTLTNGKFISNWSLYNATGTTTIDKGNLIINSANTFLNTQNTIALDSSQGMIMTYTDKTNNRTVSAGVNFQGVSTSDSNGNYAQLTSQGTKLSTDVPWTTLAATGGFHDGSIQFSVQNGVAYFSVSNLITPTMTSNKWYQCAQLPTGSSAIPSVNRATTAFSNASVWGFYVATTGGLYFKSFTSVTVTNNSTNVLAAFPIG